MKGACARPSGVLIVCAALAGALLAACASRMHADGGAAAATPAPRVEAADEGRGLSWGAAPAESPVTADSLWDGGVEPDPIDETDLESMAPRVNDAASDSRLPGGSFELTAVTGSRSELRARAGWRRFSGGVRVQDSEAVGFARYEGGGFVRAVHVGRLTARAGERLLLGRGFGAYGAPGSSGVRGGFAVAPSLSKWSGIDGAALEVGWGAWRLHSLVLAPAERAHGFRPERLWHCVSRDLGWGSVGVRAAYSLVAAPGGPSGTPDPAGARWDTWSGHGSVEGDGFNGSAEVARASGEWFFAARATTAGRNERWSLLVFRAPYDVPPGGPMSAPSKLHQGVTAGASRRLGRSKASAWLCAGRIASEKGRDTYERLIVQVERGTGGPVRWLLRAYGRIRREDNFPSADVAREISREIQRDLALRAAAWVRGGGVFRLAARIDYFPQADGGEPGTMVSLTTDLVAARADVRLSLAGHALGSGRQGWVFRPGLGSFEWFGSLWGNGSDLSIRARLHAVRGPSATVFYGSSWRGRDRWYVGLESRR